MSAAQPIEYRDASAEVRAVFDDIKASRKVADVNNFWKFLANDPMTLKRTWESVKEVMAPGALDPLTKEMIYLAVSVSNGCGYCIASHTAAARKAGMTDAMFGEVMAVTGMANETNRLANGYRVPIDPAFDKKRDATPRRNGRGVAKSNATLTGLCLSPWSTAPASERFRPVGPDSAARSPS
jgi:AhpD family alkylhydroperoxidase